MVSNCCTQLDLNVGNILYKTGEIKVGIKWDVLGSIPTKGRKVRREPTVRIEPMPKMNPLIFTLCY